MKPYIMILFLIAGVITMIPAYAESVEETYQGPNYDREFLHYNPDGSITFAWTTVPERLKVGDDKWINYKIDDDGVNVKIETANGAVNFNKASCSLRLYDPGLISKNEQPLINSISSTIKEAVTDSDVWDVAKINGEDCQVQVTQDKESLTVKMTKQPMLGSSFVTDYHFDYSGKLKITYYYTNNDILKSNHKYGFVQSFDGAFTVKVGNQTFNTLTLDKTISFDRTQIEDQIITITKNGVEITYDPQDYIHQYLWAFKISPNHINFDFTNAREPLGFGQTLVIDPTITFSSSSTMYNVRTNLASGASCPSGSYTSDISEPNSYAYIGDSDLNDYCIRMIPKWDISTFPSAYSSIDQVDLIYDVPSVSNPKNCSFYPMSVAEPGVATAAQLWNDAGNGTAFVSNDSGCTTATNNKVLNLGSSAISDFRSVLGVRTWYSVSAKIYNETRDSTSEHNSRFNAGTGQDMELKITYSANKPNAPATFTPTSQARKVLFTWTASTTTGTTSNGVTTYYIGRSLDNSTWPAANKTSTGNVTSYLDSGYWAVNKLYYVNVTGKNAVGNGTAKYTSFTTDTYPSAPLNPYTTPKSDSWIKINWSPPSSTGNDPVTGYRIQYCITCSSWTTLVNSTNTYNYNQTGLSSGQTVTYRMAAWNGVGLGAYTANFTGRTWSPTTGTVSMTSGIVGDTIQINSTVSITNASPSPVTISQLKLYRNGTLIETKATSVQIAQGASSSNFDPFWNRMLTDNTYSFKMYATVSNSTGTVSIGSSNITATREYDPSYFNALQNPTTEGQVNYTISRFDDEDGIHLQVNRQGGSLGGTWEIDCITQTNSEAAATRNQSVNWPGTWRNYSDVGYFNSTWTGLVNTHGYVTCFNPPGILFTTTSYTNSSLALFGIEIFDNSYGAMLGVPVGIFFLAMAGSMANKRTAPTWIIVVLAMAGTMAAIGFFTLNPLVWGLALVTGLLGVLVNQKVF